MADNIVAQILPMTWPVVVSDPAAPASGAPCRFGALTGIASNDEGLGGLSATETMVDFGMFVADHPVNDHGGAGISAGDAVFYVDAADRLENDSAGYFYGFALEAVAAGQTTTIRVMHVPSPGAGTLGAGTVGEANLAASSVTTGKIAAGAVETTDIKDDAVTGAKIAAGTIKVTLVNGGAAGDHVVAGITAADELVFVGHLSTAAAIATLGDLTSEFTAGAGVINNAAGTDTTNDQLMVIWVNAA